MQHIDIVITFFVISSSILTNDLQWKALDARKVKKQVPSVMVVASTAGDDSFLIKGAVSLRIPPPPFFFSA